MTSKLLRENAVTQTVIIVMGGERTEVGMTLQRSNEEVMKWQ